MMTEYYAPKARAEVEEVEYTVWELVKHRYSDSTVKWSNILEHPQTRLAAVVRVVAADGLSLGRFGRYHDSYAHTGACRPLARAFHPTGAVVRRHTDSNAHWPDDELPSAGSER